MWSSLFIALKNITPGFIKKLLRPLNPKNNVRYISRTGACVNYIKNRHLNYTIMPIDEVKEKHKKSDTLFILGSSESINSVTDEQWQHIAKHDSFGMNWWVLHSFVPTFYETAIPRNPVFRNYLTEATFERRRDYRNTVTFLMDRLSRRGYHPRLLPEMFPENPICCFYKFPKVINKKKGEPFQKSDFKNSFTYRGHLSVVLYLACLMEYKNIVLMGIDLRNAIHFYDEYPEMQWQFKLGYCLPIKEKLYDKHGTMKPKNGKPYHIDTYIYALNEFVFVPKHITLYSGSKVSILNEKLPYYNFGKRL